VGGSSQPVRIPLDVELRYSDADNTRDWLRGARFGVYIDWTPRVCWDQSKALSPYFRDRIKTLQKGAITGGINDTNGYPTGYHKWERFDPTNFNASAWVDAFVDAGAQYVVQELIDEYGWSSFDTPASTYDSAATDWGGDICAELARASDGRLPVVWHQRQHGGIDFTLAAWTKFKCRYAPHIKGYPEFRRESIEHIISHTNIYGRVAGVIMVGTWGGDGEHPSREGEYRDQFDQEHSDYLTRLLAYQPWLIMGTKFTLKNAPGFRGYVNMEGTTLPDFKTATIRPTDNITMTQFPQESDLSCWAFGYRENDRTSKTFIKLLAMSVCRDANFMVRVCPRPDGTLEPHHAATLHEIGEWLRKFGVSVYGTRGGPFEPGTWGGSTRKERDIFLHILQNSEDGFFVFPELPDIDRIESVTLLNTGADISWTNTDGVLVFDLPDDVAADCTKPDRVVRIRYDASYNTLNIRYSDLDNARFRYTESLCCSEVYTNTIIETWHDGDAVPYNSLYRKSSAGKPESLLRASCDAKGDSIRYRYRDKDVQFWQPPDWFECPGESCPFTNVSVVVTLDRQRTVSELALCEHGRRIRNWTVEYRSTKSGDWVMLHEAVDEQMGMFDYRLPHPVTLRQLRIRMRAEVFDSDGTPRRKSPQLFYIRLYNTAYYPDTTTTPYQRWVRNSGLRGTSAETSADPNGDHVANSLAFFHGALNAYEDCLSRRPRISCGSPGLADYSFVRRNNAYEFDWFVESSTDLISWATVVDQLSTNITVEPDAVTNGVDIVKCRLRIPTNTVRHIFFRLRLHEN
jgi:alpha-L-fucosidase